jgi:hypothetical protein
MKCRYDPKYASQYKSKHTKHVKLFKKVRFPLDTQKEYPNREWPHLHSWGIFVVKKDKHNNFDVKKPMICGRESWQQRVRFKLKASFPYSFGKKEKVQH